MKRNIYRKNIKGVTICSKPQIFQVTAAFQNYYIYRALSRSLSLFYPETMTTIKEYAELYNRLSNSNEYTQIPLIPEEWKVIKDRYVCLSVCVSVQE